MSESIHASWLAGEGGAKKISLFDACVTDVINAYMQCAKYLGFDTGRYIGTGPDMNVLLQRVNAGRTPSTTMVANVIHSAVSGTPYFQQPVLHGDRETVQRKQRGTHGDCSHKPGYVMRSVQRKQRGRRRHIVFEREPLAADTPQQGQNDVEGIANMNSGLGMLEQIIEVDIHKTMWAIRRMPIHCQRKCFGLVNNKKCGLYIDSKSPGEVAPSFWSYREYSDKQIPQWMWFCNSDVQHTWNVDKQVKIVPQLPKIWPIAVGTKLTECDANMLHKAGFLLRGNGGTSSSHNDVEIEPPSSKRTKKWRHGISKDAEKKIVKAIEMQGTFVKEVCIKEDEHINFYIQTENLYEVQVKAEPGCSCPDFQNRESKRKSYLVCKHLYFVYLRVLGLDQHQHKCMHQPTLHERDLKLVLGQQRILQANSN